VEPGRISQINQISRINKVKQTSKTKRPAVLILVRDDSSLVALGTTFMLLGHTGLNEERGEQVLLEQRPSP
jgi:hypothetical protein